LFICCKDEKVEVIATPGEKRFPWTIFRDLDWKHIGVIKKNFSSKWQQRGRFLKAVHLIATYQEHCPADDARLLRGRLPCSG
jgi:hypothetical protein